MSVPGVGSTSPWSESESRLFNWSSDRSLLEQLRVPKGSIREVIFTYYRVLGSYKAHREKICSICLSPRATTHFCSSHLMHLSCLVDLVYQSSRRLIESISLFRTAHISRTNLGELYSHSTYTVTIPRENLPKCPCCRSTTEGRGHLVAEVIDRYEGSLGTKVKIQGASDEPYESFSRCFVGLKTFDNLTAVLTVFEGFLSYVQNSIPALAGRIFAVQRFFLLGNIVVVARNCFLLHPLMTRKLTASDLNAWYKEHSDRIAIAGVVVLGLAAVAIVYAINYYFQSTIDFQEVLKGIPISDLGSISCKLSVVPLQQIAQFLTTSRIILELALAYFSKERLRHLSHAILQIFTLFNVSQLQWLDFERTISDPLKMVPFTVKDSSEAADSELYQKTVKKIWVSFTVLVPRNTSPVGVQSIIDSVRECTLNLFKNSSWDGYTREMFGVIVEIVYKIQIALPRLESPYIRTLITTNLGRLGDFTTVPTLIFSQKS